MNRQSRSDAGYRMLGAGALGWPRGMIRGERWEGGSGWGTRVQPWRIHVKVRQNQYNIVKLKKKKKSICVIVLTWAALTVASQHYHFVRLFLTVRLAHELRAILWIPRVSMLQLLSSYIQMEQLIRHVLLQKVLSKISFYSPRSLQHVNKNVYNQSHTPQ